MNRLFVKAFAIVFAIVLLPLRVAAQNDDFGLDFTAEAEKRLARGVDFTLEGSVRTQDNTSALERYSVGGTLGVKLLNTKTFDLKLSGGWEYIWQHRLEECETKYDEVTYNDPTRGEYTELEYEGYNITESYTQPRHRTTIALSAIYSPNKRWSFSLRESVQYNHYSSVVRLTHRYRADDVDEPHAQIADKEKITLSKDRFVLRSKATAKYNIRRSHFTPFVSIDNGCGLNYTTTKWKYTVGTDYKLSKTNSLSISYRFQTEDDDDEPNGHIVGLSYSIKL